MSRALIICCFFCFSILLRAQDPANSRFVNFSSKDGLAEKYIYSITQDPKGYIWVGTGTGLFRYDGFSFKPFRSPIDKNGSNISNILQAVYTDSNGKIWLGSLNDLQCYDPVSNHFWRPAGKDTLARKLGSYYITRFTPAANGNLYIHTSNRFFYRFNTADSTITDFSAEFPVTASRYTLKVVEYKGAAYAIHPEGIYRFSMAGKLDAFFPLPFTNDEITNGTLGTGGILLTTFTHGLYAYNPETGRYAPSVYHHPPLLNNNLFSLLEKNNECWLGSYPLFHISKEGLTTYENKRLSEFDLTANKIGDLFFDREGNLWISSHNGLSMMPWQNQQISSITLTEPSTGTPIEPTGVFNLPGSDDLLIPNTSSSGLAYYSAREKKLTVISNPLETDKFSRRIIGLVLAGNGTVYASDDKNFFKFNPSTRQLTPVIIKDQDGKPIRKVGRNITDRNGNVYISSISNGFYIWQPAAGILTHFDKTVVDPLADLEKDNLLYPCLADSRDHIWFTSSTGVYEYLPAENKWNHYNGEGVPDIPPMTNTTYIAEDRQGHIWVTTQNNGLYEIILSAGKPVINNYGRNSGIGLNTDYCIKLKADKKTGIFWLSTINGLHRFDPVNKRIISNLSVQNGLARDGGGYSYNITDNNKLVAMYYGIASVIDLDTYRFNDQPPLVDLTSVRVMDKEYLHTLITGDAVTLNYNQNFFQFEFAALQFNNHNQVQYAYQLEGADKDWVYSGDRHFVSYSGLGPGKYVLKVKAANNDGVWSQGEKKLVIVIRPPFWKTTWFLAVCGTLLAAGLWLIYRLRMKAVRREESMKAGFHQQIADMEMRALRAQMNPHFIFNSLNSIQKYILKNDHFAASQYLTKFSRLIRLILDHSNQNNILLSSEAELLQLYCEMESLRFDQRFAYSIEVDPALQPETVEIPSMLIQPYVENAIWHGLLHKDTMGRLLIRFAKNEKGHLLVTVEDDGVGRKKAMELKSKQILKKKSYGMQITEDRIALINRLNNIQAACTVTDLTDEQGLATGTRVQLEIPFLPAT
jgi:ligand-binding sensor domain-containing protein